MKNVKIIKSSSKLNFIKPCHTNFGKNNLKYLLKMSRFLFSNSVFSLRFYFMICNEICNYRLIQSFKLLFIFVVFKSNGNLLIYFIYFLRGTF